MKVLRLKCPCRMRSRARRRSQANPCLDPVFWNSLPEDFAIRSRWIRRRREWGTPPPPNNMWRAAESAAIEERRRRICYGARPITYGSSDFVAIFSHGPRQSDSVHRITARLLTIALCSYSQYTLNCSYSLVVLLWNHAFVFTLINPLVKVKGKGKSEHF